MQNSQIEIVQPKQLIAEQILKVKNWKINICQIDVGQGDSAIIVFNGFDSNKKSIIKKSILIDGGPANSVDNVFQITKQYGDTNQFDAVILTHLDRDHLEGVIETKKNNWTKCQLDEQEKQIKIQKENIKKIEDTIKSNFLLEKKIIGIPQQYMQDLNNRISNNKEYKEANTRLTEIENVKTELKNIKLINQNTIIFRPSVEHSKQEKNFNEAFPKKDLKIQTPEICESIWKYLLSAEEYKKIEEQLSVSNSKIPNLSFIAVDGNNIYKNTKTKFEGNKANSSAQNNQISIASLISLNKFNFYTSGDINQEQEKDISECFEDNKIIVSTRKANHHLAYDYSYKEEDNNMQNTVLVASYGKNGNYNHPHQGAIDNIGKNVFIYATNPAEQSETTKKQRGALPDLGIKSIVAGSNEITNKDTINRKILGNIFIETDTNESKNNRFKVSCKTVGANYKILNDQNTNNKNNNEIISINDFYIKNTKLFNKLLTKYSYMLEKKEKDIDKNNIKTIEQLGLLKLSKQNYIIFKNEQNDFLLRKIQDNANNQIVLDCRVKILRLLKYLLNFDEYNSYKNDFKKDKKDLKKGKKQKILNENKQKTENKEHQETEQFKEKKQILTKHELKLKQKKITIERQRQRDYIELN